MNAHDSTLPPHLAECVTHAHLPTEPEDDLPPWLGHRMQDVTHTIHRVASEQAQEEDQP